MTSEYTDQNFICHLRRFIGETVTIFTTSGGASGCGFTGILLAISCDYVSISNMQAIPPANPLSQTICGGSDTNCGTDYNSCCSSQNNNGYNTVGSVCDIPLNRIAAFCHNAI